MKTVMLPDGLEIDALNELETWVLYHEIFQTQAYMKHGITISDGDCIFDVGANIGLYSIFLARCYRDLTIFAFEPIPELRVLLETNLNRHIAGSRIDALDYGLSDKSRMAQFEFDRFSGLTTTMYAQDVARSARGDAKLSEWIRAGILDLHRISKISDRFAQAILTALTIPVLRSLVELTSAALFLATLARKKLFLKRVERPLKSISEVLREHNVERVDLMKIDVEGSELDVIRGIGGDDWRRIKQFVVEVHDIDGRVQIMRSMFERQGYHTIIDQEDWELHKLLGIYTIYAARN